MAKRRKLSPAKRRRALATVERVERLQEHMEDIVDEVCSELIRAVGRYPTFASGHEGWAVMHEEMDELWDEVRKRNSDPERMRAEAIQVAAMGIRFVLDVCEVDRP